MLLILELESSISGNKSNFFRGGFFCFFGLGLGSAQGCCIIYYSYMKETSYQKFTKNDVLHLMSKQGVGQNLILRQRKMFIKAFGRSCNSGIVKLVT